MYRHLLFLLGMGFSITIHIEKFTFTYSFAVQCNAFNISAILFSIKIHFMLQKRSIDFRAQFSSAW